MWYGSIALEGLLLAKLWQLGLMWRYRLLAGYLSFDVAASAALFVLSRLGGQVFHSTAYGVTYVAIRMVLWVLYFLLMLQFYALMVEEFPALRRLGGLVSGSALTGVVLTWGLLLAIDHRRGLDPYPILYYVVLQERSVFFGLSVATLLLLSFVLYFRLPIRPNVLVLYSCWGCYFLLNAVLLTLREHFGQQFAPVRNFANSLFFFLALLGALLFFSRKGEVTGRPLTALWGTRNQELEAALSLQLQGLNQVLVKVLQQ